MSSSGKATGKKGPGNRGNWETIKKYSWKPGQSGNPKGRQKQVKTTFDKCSPEVKAKIKERLYEAVKCSSWGEAKQVLDVNDDSLGEYGLVLQLAQRALAGKNGMKALVDVYEILFGRIPNTNLNVEVDEDKKDAFIKGVFIP